MEIEDSDIAYIKMKADYVKEYIDKAVDTLINNQDLPSFDNRYNQLENILEYVKNELFSFIKMIKIMKGFKSEK